MTKAGLPSCPGLKQPVGSPATSSDRRTPATHVLVRTLGYDGRRRMDPDAAAHLVDTRVILASWSLTAAQRSSRSSHPGVLRSRESQPCPARQRSLRRASKDTFHPREHTLRLRLGVPPKANGTSAFLPAQQGRSTSRHPVLFPPAVRLTIRARRCLCSHGPVLSSHDVSRATHVAYATIAWEMCRTCVRPAEICLEHCDTQRV